MTSQSPRIYLYKITFEEVSYYYYGVHKEKKFGEYYMGSPETHKWMWDFYTPKKQILEIFDYTDEGWIKAQEVENRLIRLFFNTDEWCLNESCGGNISIEVMRKVGRTSYIEGKGIHSMSFEDKSKRSKKNGYKLYEEGKGIFSLTEDEMKKVRKNGGQRVLELGVGIHGLTKEQMTKNSKRAGKITSSQRWMCLETGFISSPGGLGRYQKARGIDNDKRKRIS
jgi:hypothetical protein